MEEPTLGKKRMSRALLGGLVAMGMLMMVPAAVFAAQPHCGDVLTSNTNLTADLDCSAYSFTALTIGANKIILNLHGHTIWGPTGADGHAGVAVDDRKAVTVTNGTIANYTTGVDADYSTHTTISSLEIDGENDGNDYGIYMDGGVSNVINHVHVTGVQIGLYIIDGATHQVMNSTAHADYQGVYTKYNTGVSFSNLTVAAPYGFYDDFSHRQTYTGNVANGGTYGFYLDCDGDGKVTLTNNTANGNSSEGFHVFECYGPNYSAGAGTGSMVTGNTANGNGTGFTDYYGFNAVWKGNTANNNNTDGFSFDYPGAYIVMYNTALHNADHGFTISDNYSYYNFSKLSFNTAKRNTYGFYAGYGAPGTGNVARMNTVQNCFNVDCN